MNVFTRQEAVVIFGGNEGIGILDYVTRSGYGGREYLEGGSWREKPEGRVSGCRYNVEGFGGDIGDIATVWKFIKDAGIERPVKPDKILEQLARARLQGEALQIFSPWGPRYRKSTAKIEPSDPEIETLREIRLTLEAFAERNYRMRFLLMPADTYGTEINGLNRDFVREYFKWLEDAAYSELVNVEELEVKPWSRIIEHNKYAYERLKQEIADDFPNRISADKYERAVLTALRFNPANAEQSARKYCIERVAEAQIIESLYGPIKMSLVRKEKDSLDGPLKRIYVIRNRAPWMRGEA